MTNAEFWILIIGLVCYGIYRFEKSINEEYKEKKAWIDDIERRYPQTLEKHEKELEERRKIYADNVRRGVAQYILDCGRKLVEDAEERVFRTKAKIAVLEYAPPDIKQAYRTFMWCLANCSTPNINHDNRIKKMNSNEEIFMNWYREWLAEQESEEGKREQAKKESYNSSQL